MDRVVGGGLRALLVVVAVALHVLTVGLIVGAVAARGDQQGLSGGVTTVGTVVSETASCGRGHCFYAPVIAYAARDGQQEQVTGPDGNGHPVIGSTRSVSYRPADPGDAHVLGHGSEWIGLLVAGVVLAVVLLALDVRTALRRRSGRLAA